MKLDLNSTNAGGFTFEFFRTISYQATNGGEVGECFAVMRNISDNDFNSWINEWTKVADKVKNDANKYLEHGDKVSALNAFIRASNYYQRAEFYACHDDPRQTDTWVQSRKCFSQAIDLISPKVESVEIPFEDSILPGYFVHGGDGPCPTLIAMSGFDGSAEELYHFIGAAAGNRGWNCLIFEGPGQRGALHLNPKLIFRSDYEVPVHAVIDYALSRSDVDDRLALIGYSLGGYLAPRAAAFEPRIKACIANSLLADVGAAWNYSFPAFLRNRSPKSFDRFFNYFARHNTFLRWTLDQNYWEMGISQPHELLPIWQPYNLWGTEEHFSTPLLSIYGEEEIAATSKNIILDIAKYIDLLQCPFDIKFFNRESGGASHCQAMGGIPQTQAAIFEWLNSVFDLGDTRNNDRMNKPRINMPNEFPGIVAKYHGKETGNTLQKYLQKEL